MSDSDPSAAALPPYSAAQCGMLLLRDPSVPPTSSSTPQAPVGGTFSLSACVYGA